MQRWTALQIRRISDRLRVRGNRWRTMRRALAGFRLGQPLAGIPQLVGDQQSRHEEKAFIANLPELGRKPIDTVADMGCKLDQAWFLTIAASQPVGPAIDGHRDLPHGAPPTFDSEDFKE